MMWATADGGYVPYDPNPPTPAQQKAQSYRDTGTFGPDPATTIRLLNAAAQKNGIDPSTIDWAQYAKPVAMAMLRASGGNQSFTIGTPAAYVSNLILREASAGTTGGATDPRFAAKASVFTPDPTGGNGYYDNQGQVYKATEQQAQVRDQADQDRHANDGVMAGIEDTVSSFGSMLAEAAQDPGLQAFAAFAGAGPLAEALGGGPLGKIGASVITSALRGQDPLMGAITSGLGDAFSGVEGLDFSALDANPSGLSSVADTASILPGGETTGELNSVADAAETSALLGTDAAEVSGSSVPSGGLPTVESGGGLFDQAAIDAAEKATRDAEAVDLPGIGQKSYESLPGESPYLPTTPSITNGLTDAVKTVKNIPSQITKPITDALTEAGVPKVIVDAVPNVLTGAVTSAVLGGDALTGAIVGGLTSVGIPSGIAGAVVKEITGGSGGGTGGTSGGTGGTGGSGSGTGSGTTGSVASGLTAPSTAMLTASPWLQPQNINSGSKTQATPLFSGLSAAQTQVHGEDQRPTQMPMYPTEDFARYQPIVDTQPIPVAHGGLIRFAEGGEVDKKINEYQKQMSKDVSIDDQIKDYLSRSSMSNARLESSPLLGSKMNRGRAARAEPIFSGLRPSEVSGAVSPSGYSARPMQSLRQLDPIMGMSRIPFVAHGGSIHPQLANVLESRNFKINKEMIPGPEGRYYAKHEQRGFAVGGAGTGQSDDIPTMLSDGEYVFDADTVAALGDGSTKAGSAVLDKMREEIRKHKRSAPVNDIPPKAKKAMAYLKTARGGK